MKTFILILIAVVAHGELEGLLSSMPQDILSGLVEQDAKLLKANNNEGFQKMQGIDAFSSKPMSLSVKPMYKASPVSVFPGAVAGKKLKAAAVVPLKKVAVKKAVTGKVLVSPKLKKGALMKKSKPKVYSLKPIVHVIEKPVPVYHKVPVPKKVIVPKFYPVKKFIPVPKIIPVPVKVPVKKIIPKIVKIPKAIPIPKIVPVKKPIPMPIPYPVAKYHKVPIPKPVPYAKYIPVPIYKKVPKFVPVPVKKIIKVPKPYYVPVKVPHFTTSYVKTPMVVDVPDVKKIPSGGKLGVFKKPGMNLGIPSGGKLGVFKKPGMNLGGGEKEAKFLESLLGAGKQEGSMMESLGNLGAEDKELMKLLSNSMQGDKKDV